MYSTLNTLDLSCLQNQWLNEAKSTCMDGLLTCLEDWNGLEKHINLHPYQNQAFSTLPVWRCSYMDVNPEFCQLTWKTRYIYFLPQPVTWSYWTLNALIAWEIHRFTKWQAPSLSSTLLKQRQLRFLGHILRMPEDEPCRRCAFFVPTKEEDQVELREDKLLYDQKLLGDAENDLYKDTIASLLKDRFLKKMLLKRAKTRRLFFEKL